MSCRIENLTVDATVHGDIMEVPTFDGGTEFIAAQFREPHVESIFCTEHGYLAEDGDVFNINEIVKKHLEEQDGKP